MLFWRNVSYLNIRHEGFEMRKTDSCHVPDAHSFHVENNDVAEKRRKQFEEQVKIKEEIRNKEN